MERWHVLACARSIAAEFCRARSHTSRCVCSWVLDCRPSLRCCRLAACPTALLIPPLTALLILPPCCHIAVRLPGCARPLLCALWPCAVRLVRCADSRPVIARQVSRGTLAPHPCALYGLGSGRGRAFVCFVCA